MLVLVVLVAVGAAVLVPRELRAHAERRAAFVLSFGHPPDATTPSPAAAPTRSGTVRRRRQIVGVLLAGMAVTALAGLLPTLRPLLYAHLLLDDAFLAYIALLAHGANRRSAVVEMAAADVAVGTIGEVEGFWARRAGPTYSAARA